jgi:hypothetical protein
MESAIKKLRKKGLIQRSKISAYKVLDYDLNNPDDYLQYLTDLLFDDLAKYMVKQKMTQSDLAQSLGVSKQDVSKRFMGKNLTITWLVRAIRSIGGVVNLKILFQDKKNKDLPKKAGSRSRKALIESEFMTEIRKGLKDHKSKKSRLYTISELFDK